MRFLPWLLAACLAGDEVVLVDGTVIDGEVVADAGDTVRIRVTQGAMSAERSWSRAEVARIVRGPSARQQALDRIRGEATALPATAPAGDWVRLAQRARAAGEPALSRAWALRAVGRDRSCAEAQRLLGRELVNGVWMRPDESAAARGLVRHDGRLMSWDEREAALAAAAARRARQQAALAELADRRRQQAAAREGQQDYAWPERWNWRVDSPARVVWWGGLLPQQQACQPGSMLRLGASGSWGGVDWKLHLDW